MLSGLRVVVALGLILSPNLMAAPGLLTASGGRILVRAAPRVALGPGEGFTPASLSAGIEWTGRLSVARTGQYTFFLASGSLRIEGQLVGTGPVRIEAGTHQLEYRLDDRPESGRVDVEWEGPGFAREPIPPRVLSHAAGNSADVDGRAVFEDFGCSNCHLSDSPSIQRRPGPVLTGVGARVKSDWIGNWLDSPMSFRPWATMPEMLSATERADVAAFLSTLVDDPIGAPEVSDEHGERGRTTFQSYGCAACHAKGLPLDGLGSKMTVARIRQFIRDPIRYSPDGRMPSFHLDETEALELAAYLSLSRNTAFERATRPGDPGKGRELIRSSGCLACHALEGFVSEIAAPALETLDEGQGCLADSVPLHLPRYRLSDGQRSALRSFIANYRVRPDRTAAPTYDLPRRLAQLRCRACHEIDGDPPSGSLAETAPPLTGVGDKLRSSWIRRAIGSENRILDWQELRMPSFGPSHAAWLAEALAKASGVDPEGPELRLRQGEAEAGHDRLGMDASRGGMGCIGCHGWGEHPALGENGPNLVWTGRRLRESWFRRWMRAPARILAGTSMPSYFGGADDPASAAAISDLWAAFVSAPRLPPPTGFESADAHAGSEAMPVPRDRAVVIRWDMPEASPAAIAVGLPGGLSYCFDAGESRLRYAWRGGFLDMTRTLLTKKNRATNLTETAEIVGEVFFREKEFPIRVGDRRRIPQRRFRGYRLVDSIPEFHYEVDGVTVHERIVAERGGIVRQFRLIGVREPMWFVPTASGAVETRSTLNGLAIPRGELVSFEVAFVPR